MCDASGECLPCKITRLEKENALLVRFAKHREACSCEVCRSLSIEERFMLHTILSVLCGDQLVRVRSSV